MKQQAELFSTPSMAWKSQIRDCRWWSSLTSSTWLGSMPASYSRSTSSRRDWRKEAEELRAEYMEGKADAAVGTWWAAAEATTLAAADTDTEAVPVRKNCKRNKTLDTW